MKNPRIKKFYKCRVDGVDKEDSGKAITVVLDPIDTMDNDNGVFFRIQSWDDANNHDEFKALKLEEGKEIKVTLELEEGFDLTKIKRMLELVEPIVHEHSWDDNSKYSRLLNFEIPELGDGLVKSRFEVGITDFDCEDEESGFPPAGEYEIEELIGRQVLSARFGDIGFSLDPFNEVVLDKVLAFLEEINVN
jgi:hypothetical protein